MRQPIIVQEQPGLIGSLLGAYLGSGIGNMIGGEAFGGIGDFLKGSAAKGIVGGAVVKGITGRSQPGQVVSPNAQTTNASTDTTTADSNQYAPSLQDTISFIRSGGIPGVFDLRNITTDDPLKRNTTITSSNVWGGW